jgi:AraC-like DNA-binding protein
LSAFPEAQYSDHYHTALVHQVASYIHEHLAEPLSIDSLARQFHLSPTGLKASFHQLYGKPLHQYISQCRMERAAELLRTTDFPVAQIAALVGYSSVSQFGAVFKKFWQFSPAQYRFKQKNV